MVKSKEENSSQHLILLAEDDLLSSSYFRAVLSSEGYEVIHVDNGADAVETVRDNPGVSLVLMDIKMPKKSGIEAAQEIRSFNKTVPLIAQTAFALAGDKTTIMKAGFNDYVTKPLSRQDLIAIINSFL